MRELDRRDARIAAGPRGNPKGECGKYLHMLLDAVEEVEAATEEGTKSSEDADARVAAAIDVLESQRKLGAYATEVLAILKGEGSAS